MGEHGQSPPGVAFAARVEDYRGRLAQALNTALPAATIYPARLHEAMRYACQGGKRLRALLVYAAGEALRVPIERLDAAAAAVELIHAYSLVHDDLPAMDDDALRRGRPTCHVAFDEATAILVGDALQTLAFAVLARDDSAVAASHDWRAASVACLAQAAGSRGMVGGQAVDMQSGGRALTLAELEALHVHKTGALIRACVQLACLRADGPESERHEALDRYAKALGLAYQIQDDVLDVDGASERLGKTAGKDESQLKCTYPQVMGLPAARERAAELFANAHAALASLGPDADALRWLAEHIRRRDH